MTAGLPALIKSSVFSGDERPAWISELANRPDAATGPVHFVLPVHGIGGWDRQGEEAHDPETLADMVEKARKTMRGTVPLNCMRTLTTTPLATRCRSGLMLG